MLFNSLSFLGFFAVLVFIYYASPHRYRWGLLLVASLYSYAILRAEYVLLLLGVTAVGYIGGIRVEGAESRAGKKTWLAGSIAIVLVVLFFDKYVDFFSASLGARMPQLGVVVAAGLSFYSFSCISYLADVYTGRLRATRHVGHFALYLAFFPKLLAGPIERARPFLDQLAVPVRFDPVAVSSGLQLMLWGLFKKVVIADRLAPIVDAAYRRPALASPADLLIATYFFAFQLYCDFSGYSDIAIGVSRVLGLDLMENFRRPYLSRTVREFWAQRWHLSLSAWFRDYVYIPLGGNRASTLRVYANIMTVFVLSGLWHGANFTFVVWGALNGAYHVVGLLVARLRHRRDLAVQSSALWSVGRGVVTFHLILVSWVFFRAASIGDAAIVLTRIAGAGLALPRLIGVRLQDTTILVGIGLVLLLLAVEALDDVRSIWARLDTKPTFVRWAAYYALLLLLVTMGNWNLTQFMYMQF